jgi:hypothetical protein
MIDTPRAERRQLGLGIYQRYLKSSPGNYQAWLALAGAEDKDFARRLPAQREADRLGDRDELDDDEAERRDVLDHEIAARRREPVTARGRITASVHRGDMPHRAQEDHGCTDSNGPSAEHDGKGFPWFRAHLLPVALKLAGHQRDLVNINIVAAHAMVIQVCLHGCPGSFYILHRS